MKRTHVVLSLLCALALVGCSSGKKKLELGGSCSLNSDCTDGLLCKFGACHKACVKSVDCATGERCVQVDGIAVCQMVSEQGCGANYVCPAGLACMKADNTCRNTCTPTVDCLGGQVCSAGFCVEKTENVAGLDGGTVGAEAGVSADAGAASGADVGAASLDVALATDAPKVVTDALAAIDTARAMDAVLGAGDAILGRDAGTGEPPVGTLSQVCVPECGMFERCVAGLCQPWWLDTLRITFPITAPTGRGWSEPPNQPGGYCGWVMPTVYQGPDSPSAILKMTATNRFEFAGSSFTLAVYLDKNSTWQYLGTADTNGCWASHSATLGATPFGEFVVTDSTDKVSKPSEVITFTIQRGPEAGSTVPGTSDAAVARDH